MIALTTLPALNATLNTLTALLLCTGFVFIRQKKVFPHRVCMSLSFLCSCVFLISYLIYHFNVGTTRFTGEGWLRPAYFSILLTHTILAAAVPVLAVLTIVAAIRNRIDRHRMLARITLPIWLYVSVTGVVIYWMLYHLTDSSRAHLT